MGLALVNQDQDKSETAIKAIQDALAQEKDPQVLAIFYFYLGGVFYSQEPPDLKTAEVAYQKSIQLDPSWAKAYAMLGVIKTLQYKPKEGLAYLEEAKDLLRVRGDIQMVKHINELLGLAHGILAGNLVKERKFEQAVAELKTAIALYPDYADSYNLLGDILLLQGKLKEAVEPLKKARSLYRAKGKTQDVDRVNQELQKVEAQ